jgi:hypothetical protein
VGKKLTTEGFNAGVKEAHGDCCLSVQSKSVGFIVFPQIIIGLFFFHRCCLGLSNVSAYGQISGIAYFRRVILFFYLNTFYLK